VCFLFQGANLAGYDKLDIAGTEHPKEDYVAAVKQPVSNFRLGIPRAPFFDRVDGDTSKGVAAAVGVLQKMTNRVEDVSLPCAAAWTGNDLNSIGEEVARAGPYLPRFFLLTRCWRVGIFTTISQF